MEEKTLGKGFLARALRSARLLERLKLRFEGVDFEDDESNASPEDRPFDIALGFGGTTWPRLREFSLYVCELPGSKALVDFLGRHASTLKHLDLFCIALRGGSWTSAFQNMKQQSLRLETFDCSWIETPYVFNADRLYVLEFFDGHAPNPASHRRWEKKGVRT